MSTTSAVKDRIRHYWSESATTYDDSFGHGLHTSRDKELWLELLRRNVRLPQGASLLDVGCGTGFLSLLLAELGFTVTGIDLSESMRGQAHRKANESGLDITFLPGDAEDPPFSSASFDGIISRHLVWTLPSPQKALTSWRHLLRPGGSVMIIDGVWTPRCIASRLRFLAANCIRLSQGKFDHLFWTRKYARKTDLPYYGGAEPEKVIQNMKEAGLQHIWIDRMDSILAHERQSGPLDYRISYGKNRRYLIGGIK